ncbi:multidrug and toxin extrusion protein 1-like [Haliotis cracherodii]|uniref:multidrug and toxin extrusion protein 1-like n=1 Tax=Haliotis cracherodii TaxID=6455 RepID=UPI0039E97B8B
MTQQAEENAPKTYHRCLRLNKWKFSKAYKDELRAMLTLAWPVTMSSTLEQLILVTNAMFTGHLGTLQLDATALGQAVIDVFGCSIVVGINTACDTLFSQTYGSTNKKNLGILLQRGWSPKCWLEWGRFIGLAVPGFLMVALSWWCIQFIVALTGYLGTVQLAAQAVLFQIVTTSDMVSYGMSTAAGMRIGNLLGRGDHLACQTAYSAAIMLAGITSALPGSVLTIFRSVIAKAFTEDSEVADLVTQVLPILTIYLCIKNVVTHYSHIVFMIIFPLQTVLGGVVRGIGHQRFGACATFLAYYAICLPLGLPLMFLTSLGIAGIWIAYCVSATFLGVCFLVRLNKIDWKEEVVLAQARAGANRNCSELNGGDYSPLIQEDCTSDDEDSSDENPARINESRVNVKRIIVSRLIIVLSVIGILAFGIIVRTMQGYSHFPESVAVLGLPHTLDTPGASQTEPFTTLHVADKTDLGNITVE